MPHYNFASLLSPLDFELLSKDLLEAELGIRLENFKEGRDKGIDLRYAQNSQQLHSFPSTAFKPVEPQRGPDLIVQCKRYSAFTNLKSELGNSELPKIIKLQPERYILTTAVALSPQQTEEIRSLLSPFVQSTGDIFGSDRLNSLLAKHPEVERRHLKLWATSAGLLESILHAATHVVSKEEIERTIAAAKIYVRNPSFDEALTILKKHRVCIISGLPGIGKTTLARMLLLYFYERKFDVVKIEADISEARNVGYHNNPRFYFYDDFLGQTGQADKLNKNEDQKLLDFMASIRSSKDSLFVLTTREYILNQARLHYEKIDREKFDHRTCIIDLSKYSRRIRAQILYNHLHFSDLPRPYLESLVEQRGYLKIVDHPNYNPRLIEYLTSSEWVRETPFSGYVKLFMSMLDNPVEIWGHAFRNQLSARARHVLLVLTSLPAEVALNHLEKAFLKFHRNQCSTFGISQAADDFRMALKELDGTFLKTRKVQNVFLVRFQNPSIRDFMQNLIFTGESLPQLIRSSTFFEQPEWFIAILRDLKPQSSSRQLASHSSLIVDTLQRVIDAPGCSFTVHGSSNREYLELKKSNPANRLGWFLSAIEGLKLKPDVDWLLSRLKKLTESLENGGISVADSVEAVDSLRNAGFMETAEGTHFAALLKSQALVHLVDLDDFQALAAVLEALPQMFTAAELSQFQDAYSEFAEGYATDHGIDDPEEIREEASRLGTVGEAFGVDTDNEKRVMRDEADELEKEAESPSDWDSDDRRSLSQTEICLDEELDGMFSTLRH